VTHLAPEFITNEGNSYLKIKSVNFNQFKYDNGTEKNVPIQCRYYDGYYKKTVGEPANMIKISETEYHCKAPKTSQTGDIDVQMSSNGQQWQSTGTNVKFYNGPKITQINPTYGVTKNPRSQKMIINGENFDCPNNDCSKIKVRFASEKNDLEKIFVDGKMLENGSVECEIPKYPAPETLDVDISFND